MKLLNKLLISVVIVAIVSNCFCINSYAYMTSGGNEGRLYAAAFHEGNGKFRITWAATSCDGYTIVLDPNVEYDGKNLKDVKQIKGTKYYVTYVTVSNYKDYETINFAIVAYNNDKNRYNSKRKYTKLIVRVHIITVQPM